MAKSGTEAEIKAWVAGTKPYDWYNQCAGLVMSICRHFGNAPAVGAGGAYATATLAYEAATIESKDPKKAPAGAIHYWSYTTTINGVRKNYGHVVVDIRGAGSHTLSATKRASPMWGVNAGLISVADQTAAIGSAGRYLGWSRFYGKSYYVKVVTPTAPQEDEVPEIVLKEFRPTAQQVVLPGVKTWLYLDDKKSITVANGPLVIGGGVLMIRGTAVGGPFDVGGFIPVLLVEAVIDKVVDGAVASSRSLGNVEFPITHGGSYGQYAVPPVTLNAGDRLRFKVQPAGVEKFTIGGATLRYTAYSTGK